MFLTPLAIASMLEVLCIASFSPKEVELLIILIEGSTQNCSLLLNVWLHIQIIFQFKSLSLVKYRVDSYLFSCLHFILMWFFSLFSLQSKRGVDCSPAMLEIEENLQAAFKKLRVDAEG